MYLDIVYAGLIVQIILQLYTAVYAFETYKVLNHGNFWWVLSGGFALMAARRITALLTYNPATDTLLSLGLLDKVGIPLVISFLLFFGMRRMRRCAHAERRAREVSNMRLESLRRINKRMEAQAHRTRK